MNSESSPKINKKQMMPVKKKQNSVVAITNNDWYFYHNKKFMANKVDIFIYVALNEEFTYFAETLGIELTPEELKDIPVTIYHGQIKAIDGKIVRLCIVPAGKMGNTNSGILTALLVNFLNPLNVVVLGIAGAISKDLIPGSVFIPSRVDEYLANAAAVGEDQNQFELSGNYFESDGRLLNRFSNFAVSFKSHFSGWQNELQKDLTHFISSDISVKLSEIGIDLKSANLLVGDDRQLASGPAVVKGAAFAKWLKAAADRKIAAVEMESAGVYAAVWLQIKRPRVIAIRPISDIADERKSQIEIIAGEKLRLFALTNATKFLKRSIEVGIFNIEHDTAGSKPTALIKQAFIVGGKLDNTEHGKPDSGVLNTACYQIGMQLALAQIDLIACSPFDDSADYYAISGFASVAVGRKIYLHYPQHEDVLKHKERLLNRLKGKKIEVIPFGHPSYNSPDEQGQAWSFSQLQALEQADAVIAIGGNLAKSANLTLRVAEVKKKMIIPFSFLKGISELVYRNTDWKALYPSLDTSWLTSEAGIEKLPEIIRQMRLTEIKRQANKILITDKIFISRAKKDYIIASDLQYRLKQNGLNALLGDEAVGKEKSVIPAIDEYLNICKLHIILWSANFALSPWCYDELMVAIQRQQSGQSSILFFNIDGSAVIPSEARSLTQIAVNDAVNMVETVLQLVENSN
jgi:nucleoside phosphorylase